METVYFTTASATMATVDDNSSHFGNYHNNIIEYLHTYSWSNVVQGSLKSLKYLQMTE
jgi:hypothetical protein